MSRCDTSATKSWMKSFVFADYTVSLQPMFPPKHFDMPPGCSEGLYGRLFTNRGFLRQTTTQGLLDPTRPISLTLTLTQIPLQSRALSLRNLVLGYECGRVFPAGVGPGSPSRDAVNWLPPRFSLSVETRRRFGWLRMMVFPGAHLFRAPIWCPPGGWRHARGREHCRGEPGSSLWGGYAPDSAKAEGSSIVDEPGED